MPSGRSVLRRMENRVSKLSGDIDYYIGHFEKSDNFVGPSIYFHHKTLEQRGKHSDIESLLDDDLYYDYIYATLASWGMHRMGPGKTKLVDIEDMKDSIKLALPALKMLWGKSIYELKESQVADIVNIIWNIFININISVAEVKIVACSKTLHHILPDLIPPIDRSYTYNFFYNRTMLSITEKEALSEMYLMMYKIAIDNKNNINRWVGKGFNTSITKVIDNAIIGFVLDEL